MLNFNCKEDKFYQMLLKSAEIVNEAAIELRKSLECLDKREIQVKNTSELENIGDELVRTLIKELNDAFITPIDREDIYEIIKEMDNILDSINSTVHRFIMFDITESTEELREICNMLVQATEELVVLMSELKIHGCKSKSINTKIMNISKTESEADKIFRKTVQQLFKYEENPIAIMKWKEIYQILEDTVDNCEKVANIVERVVIKNA
ncbi:DUF47 domain-containing protein [Clostridium botulinum]|uniref:DUF47 domain-containing protein n=1 Tax=Clostridium TaxID=1485 RepID=UPI0013EE8307|nr:MULTISPECIES: DUF47 family protein [unclassified Clostridium]MBZ9693123.1 DUF47 family protein [Clostridium sp. M14]NFO89365.1 DUF47 domain-containing protein [Clostridium botulinum]NFP29777.1 DUF47 domain-containing protein [Clostridium botulinum]